MRGLVVVAVALTCAGCAEFQTDFSPERAHGHVRRLGEAFPSRQLGGADSPGARAYLADQLTAAGLSTRVQSAVGHNRAYGVSGHVHNVIGTLDGDRRDAIALVAHYDAVPHGSGAVDDGFGTAVAVETARVLAARPHRRWSLFVLLTDGEEEGLLGAEALLDDPDVRSRTKVVINLEAMGGDTPVLLFESGPGNGWLVDLWAEVAPRPRGASFNYEIYRRMPNDTDFSVFRRAGIPGLNFGAVGESYSYHTPLESPARVTPRALREAGGAAVALVDRLQSVDINRRTADTPTYFDLFGRVAVSWSARADAWLSRVTLVLALVALARAAHGVWRATRWRGLITAVVWTVGGALVAAAAAVGAAALLRAVREVYHPWYAHPLRLVVLLALVAAATGWLAARLAGHLPRSVVPPRLGAAAVLPTLMCWTGLAAFVVATAPRAAFLWVLPLLALAAPVAIAGYGRAAVIAGSLASLAIAGSLWVPGLLSLVAFVVPLLGGFPIVVPVWLLPAIVLMAAMMVAPPLVALLVAWPIARPRFLTRALLVSTGFAFAWAYQAPAYTAERPLRVSLVSVTGEGSGTVTMVSANEPIPPLGAGLPVLTPATSPPDRLARYTGRAPFVAIAPPAPAGAPPDVRCEVAGDVATIAVDGTAEPARLRLELPAGVTPSEATPPGVVRGGAWSATLAGALPGAPHFSVTAPGAAHRVCDGRLIIDRRGPRWAAWSLGADPATAGTVWTARLVDVRPLR